VSPLSRRGVAAALMVLLGLTAPPAWLGSGVAHAAPAAGRKAAAAAHYAAGQKLYAGGRFAAALARFSAAQKLLPHPQTLFNIARCRENLGRLDKALESYQAALKLTKDSTRRADISARIKRLAVRPGRLFVTSTPPGARVSVDQLARATRGARLTPAVLKLAPGPHLLVLRKEGYGAQLQRVVVKPGDDRTLKLTLQRLATTKPRPCKPKEVVVERLAPPLTQLRSSADLRAARLRA
jgi:tetratricopeptide (TPR) repeat protein